MHPMLNTAIKAARLAGNIINRASLDLENVSVARKGPKNYVTETDHAAEQAIIDTLRTAYPDHSFLGEESGETAAPAKAGSSDTGNDASEFQWIIDPLDGTTNFIHGFPAYAVSVALLHRGQLAHAVIYDPARNELFTASRGSGAFLNDRRIRVSGQLRYHDALIGTHVPGSASEVTVNPRFSDLLGDCAAARRIGSTVLELAYVACGRLDAFCGVNLKPWDLAAGGLLVLEAGGLVSDFDGEQSWLKTGSVLAATPKLLPRMLGYMAR
ncbi:MAG: inositol monophosphatase [Alcaligenaceae bacterium]|nr:inositol monophosphatase [Alcaligenaceae bacterium]